MLRLWIAGLLIVTAAPARAGWVWVQYPGGSEQVAIPGVAEEIGAGFSASANFGTGQFAAASSVDNGNSFAYSGLNLLQIRWVPSDGVQVLQLQNGWLSANVSGTLSVPVPPDTALGGNVGSLVGQLDVSANGVIAVATFSKTLAFSGDGSGGPTSNPSTENGGQIVVIQETPHAVEFDLLMPPLSINPNQVFQIDGMLQTNVLSNGGFVAANASNSYLLSLVLPSNMNGSLIDLATGAPLDVDWVTVPEPSLVPLVGLVLFAVARRRRTDSRPRSARSPS